jgi:hypothetical protein
VKIEMKNIWILILALCIPSLLFAAPINLQINADYYSHNLEPSAAFAATDLAIIYTSKQIGLDVRSLQSTQSSALPLSSFEMASGGASLQYITGLGNIEKQYAPSQYGISLSSDENLSLFYDMPYLSNWIVYNYSKAQLEDLSLGFNVNAVSVLGYMNSSNSSVSFTMLSGLTVAAGLTDQSTLSFKASMPVSFGNFLLNAGIEYVSSPTTFKPDLQLFYMGKGVMPYLTYDTTSTPTVSAGLCTMNFSLYGKVLMEATPTYIIGSQYRSDFGAIGGSFNYQNGQMWIDANFDSVPFGFNFLQFNFYGQSQFESNGAYRASAALVSDFNILSAEVKGWGGLNTSNSNGFSYFYGLEVTF